MGRVEMSQPATPRERSAPNTIALVVVGTLVALLIVGLCIAAWLFGPAFFAGFLAGGTTPTP
jgi:fatty acid desaturase